MPTLQSLYIEKPIPEWPTLSKDRQIPHHQKSKYGEGHSIICLGVLKAVVAVLSRSDGFFKAHQQTWHLCVGSSSSKRKYHLGGESAVWYVELPKSYLLPVAAIMDAHTTERQHQAEEFLTKWKKFISELEFYCQSSPPFTPEQLQQASVQQNLTELCMGVCDALYYYLKHRLNSNLEIKELPSPKFDEINAEKFDRVLFYTSQLAHIQRETPLFKSLQRLIKRGGTALLSGPTGSGKTEAIKAAALEAEAVLVKIFGHPGLDDSQLFGSTYPDGKGGFKYVEGPLSEAWRCAAEGKKVVLLIDELARMDAYYHAILIGALDTYSGREIKARPRFHPENIETIQDEERYYALLLRNGQVLVAPKSLLSVVCTTNLGSDYQQATTELDPALMRRFEVHFDVERLDINTRIAIIRSQKLPQKVAELMVQLEEFTTKHTAADGSLLSRAANVGVLINWGNEAKALVQEGVSWKQALEEAVRTTAIPFVCPRLSNGRLEAPAVDIVLEELQRLLVKL